MTMRNSSIALVTVAFLLSAALVTEALLMTGQTDRAISLLREVLLKHAWAHEVRIGIVAIETRVLIFRETGEVSERIYDDTGVHETTGSWQLKEADGADILVLTGEGLRDKGQFSVKRDPQDKAIELREVGSDRAIQFQRRKGVIEPRSRLPSVH